MDIKEISRAVEKVVSEMGLKSGGGEKYLAAKPTVTLALAEELAEAVVLEGRRRKMKIVVAVADCSGDILAVKRMDGAFPVSYGIAVNKAYTSVVLKMPTKELAKLASPDGGSLYGIQFADPRIVIFGGGEPLQVNGKILGGIGVSGGSAEEDTSLGEFAKNKFKEIISWHLTKK